VSDAQLFVNAPEVPLDSPDRIRATDPTYWQLHEFLNDEAALLDADQLLQWLELTADDVRYRMPVRVGVHRGFGDGFARRMYFYNDTKKVLAMRIHRLVGTRNGWVEDPPSRTSRFVTGVRAYTSDKPEEFVVHSKLLLTRSRSDLGEVKLLSAHRLDRLRRQGGDIKLANRDIYLDQTTINMHNMAVFL